jgi:hypothetical protein
MPNNECPECGKKLEFSKYFDTAYCPWCGWYPKAKEYKKSKPWSIVTLVIILVIATGFIPVLTGVYN